MSVVRSMLVPIPVPRMVRVRQRFPLVEVADVAAAVGAELRRDAIAQRVRPGMRVAVGVGSRGMADIALIAATVVAELKRLGAQPFVVPAMGSHGGATSEGQADVLARLGITEDSVGCPIVSSMDVIEVGRLADGMAVLMDRHAAEADGIVVINRVKAHSGFVGPNESGLVKMLSIGLGKHRGAEACHARGFGQMARLVVEMARLKLARCRVLFGVATIENAADRIARIVAIPADSMIDDERALLVEAKAMLPRILLDPLDVLVVDRLGKEFSGSGMDPYITGRAVTPHLGDLPTHAESVAVLDVSDYSHGNCSGMGLANVTTRRLFDKIDFEHTYANTLTARAQNSSRIPLVMDSDRLAIQAAIQLCGVPDHARIRMVRISDTSHVGEILVSEALVPEARAHASIEFLGEPRALPFDADGNLPDVGRW